LPGSPEDWIAHAKSDLNMAIVARNHRTTEILAEQICFHTQQAAEKSLKAVLLYNSIGFRFQHDLAYLLGLLENANIPVPADIADVESLTPYAVDFRYPPGAGEELTGADIDEAIDTATKTVAWAESIVIHPPQEPTLPTQ